MTRLSDFDYVLPQELIAQTPATERDRSRLLHLSPEGSIRHHTFRDLPGLLQPGDLLVLNDTRVFPARLEGVRAGGGRSELLLLERLDSERWRVLAKPARKLRNGARLSFGGGRLEAEVLEVEDDGKRIVGFRFEGDWDALLEELGTTPLPPYIESSEDEPTTRLRYQTIYARPSGSIAAPTAGLHFTDAMFEALQERGVDVAFVTLHVGHATFQPIREEKIEAHRMGVERYVVPEQTREKIRGARRVVAVGTTTVRALESAALADFPQGWQETDLFITPGFQFRVVSGLLTNFHLPKSSLLILVSVFGGRERVLGAYREAVRELYRFYSFGDAMLLYPARVP
ncbi:MAG TPA: tRNA preQ1(34) S-adenosylmethionine ribosyltransferase-isomerase QueA [Vicinamibacteria bacterium]|nr:tRNA preQ1(34) S-adenosylmethionine ribosyltransferase-isomerase QueA [Vicinamibacteria bacterium]